jgi:hypothetical protein
MLLKAFKLSDLLLDVFNGLVINQLSDIRNVETHWSPLNLITFTQREVYHYK